MPTYIRLVKLTDEFAKDVKTGAERLGKARKILEDNGCKLLEVYATLGRYDFVGIIEAPDNKTAAKISALIAALGVTAETLPAVKGEEFLASLA